MNSNVIRRFAVGAALVGLAVGIGIAAAVGRIQSPRARVPGRIGSRNRSRCNGSGGMRVTSAINTGDWINPVMFALTQPV